MRSAIEQRVNALIDVMQQSQTCDFVSQFAYPLPSLVIFDLLGIPTEHHESLRNASRATVYVTQAVFTKNLEMMDEIAGCLTIAQQIFERYPRTTTTRAEAGSDLSPSSKSNGKRS
jgi:cytochrome P450